MFVFLVKRLGHRSLVYFCGHCILKRRETAGRGTRPPPNRDTTAMPSGFPPDLVFTRLDWPLAEGNMPDDEDRYLPRGYLAGAPSVIVPERVPGPDHIFWGDPKAPDPVRNAPLYDPTGGTVYFETSKADHLKALMRLLTGFVAERKDYIAFGLSAKDPVEERFLDQVKILTHVAAASVFEVDHDTLPPEQSLTLEEAVIGFVKAQYMKWEEPGKVFSSTLSGAAGGDGEYSKEALAFGLHVENSHWGVVRLWSRPWLVTK